MGSKVYKDILEIVGTAVGIIILLLLLPLWIPLTAVWRHRTYWLRLKWRLENAWWQLRDRWRGGEKSLSACNKAFRQAALTGNAHNVEILLQRGADPNLSVEYDCPLLLRVAEIGSTEGVRLLLEAGAKIDAVHPQTQHTPLMRAAKNGHASTVSLLLEYGADIEAANIVGNTSLLLAAIEGRTEVVRLLLNEYARRKTTPKQARAAMNIAKKLEFREIVDLLRPVDKREDTSLLLPWQYPASLRLHDPNRN